MGWAFRSCELTQSIGAYYFGQNTEASIQVIPPYRIMQKTFRSRWTMKNRDSKDLVFCHNDLSTHNIIVDEKTLKIKAILDWEYAGFFPAEFEGMYFRRPGASVALDGEDDDVEKLLEVMRINEA